MARLKIIAAYILILLLPNNTCEEPCESLVRRNEDTSLHNCSHHSFQSNHSNSTQSQSQGSCRDSVSNLNLIYSIFLIIVTIVAFLGNIFVCIVIIRSIKLRSQSVNHLLLSLALSDILVSILSLPVKIHMGFHNQQFCMSSQVCWFFFYSDIFANCSSVTHLLVISIQRFVAITYPFDSQFILSRQRIDVLIALVWLYSAVWSALCTFHWGNPSLPGVRLEQSLRVCMNDNPIYWTCVYVAVFIIPLVVMGLLQFAILHNVKSHTRDMLKMERNADKIMRMRRREIRVTKTVSIVYAAFTACWLPVCLITVSSSWCPACFKRFRNWNSEFFVATFLVFVQMLPPLSSTLNPFIYVISGDEFKKAFKAVLLPTVQETTHLAMSQMSGRRSSWL